MGEDVGGTSVLDAQERLRRLLDLVGQPGICRGCGAPIVWVVTKTGRRAPLDPSGETHFATCPEAAQFKRAKGGGT